MRCGGTGSSVRTPKRFCGRGPKTNANTDCFAPLSLTNSPGFVSANSLIEKFAEIDKTPSLFCRHQYAGQCTEGKRFAKWTPTNAGEY